MTFYPFTYFSYFRFARTPCTTFCIPVCMSVCLYFFPHSPLEEKNIFSFFTPSLPSSMSPPSPPSCLSRSSPCHPHHPCLTSHLRQSISRAFLKQLTDITCFLFSGFHFLIIYFYLFYGILFGVKARAGHNIRNRECANAGLFHNSMLSFFVRRLHLPPVESFFYLIHWILFWCEGEGWPQCSGLEVQMLVSRGVTTL